MVYAQEQASGTLTDSTSQRLLGGERKLFTTFDPEVPCQRTYSKEIMGGKSFPKCFTGCYAAQEEFQLRDCSDQMGQWHVCGELSWLWIDVGGRGSANCGWWDPRAGGRGVTES